jgi:hypothetical protein
MAGALGRKRIARKPIGGTGCGATFRPGQRPGFTGRAAGLLAAAGCRRVGIAAAGGGVRLVVRRRIDC